MGSDFGQVLIQSSNTVPEIHFPLSVPEFGASPVAQQVKNLPAMQEMQQETQV